MIPKFRAWYVLAEEMIDVRVIDWNNMIVDSFSPYIEIPLEKVILMQSTGLKDKNGREVFEGDIIATGPDIVCMKRHSTLGFYVEQKGKVEFIADGAVLEEFEEDAKEIADNLEIIGNIYENKEFLEADNDQ